MLPVGTVIWISLRPLIRLVLCVGCGFAITKADLFPVVAARGAGQLTLNIALPCLMFSKIVPAFTPQNIGALGPLVLVAVIYEAFGILVAWVVKQFFWVPHRFRYGILVAGGWGNYGDIPTSVIMSVTAAAPFSGVDDQNLAVAYISAFILVFSFTLFPCGAHRLIAWDFEGPEVEDDEAKELMRIKRRKFLEVILRPSSLLRRRAPPLPTTEEGRQFDSGEITYSSEKDVRPPIVMLSRTTTPSQLESSTNVDPATQPTTRVSSYAGDEPKQAPALSSSQSLVPTDPPRSFRRRIFASAKTFFAALISPPSITIILAFPIALVTPLKALFVPVPNSPIPNAPDGQPPLAFIQDATTFIGAASVPLGLICLGSALARLKVPRGNEWKNLPLGAISWFAVGKILLTPVLGVLVTQGLTKAGVIDPTDTVLRFVCMFFSCLPTATIQVYLTQVYSGTGEATHISSFLIPQYALMLISMTVLTAYSINLIF